MLTSFALALTLFQDKALPDAKMGQVQLVMLMEGKVQKLSADEETKRQEAHLKGLQDLWNERKALTLGPVEGEGKLRGLLVIDEDKPESAEKLLANDAWVKSGALKLETRTWFMAKNYITKGPKFMDLTTVWFGTLTRPDGLAEVSPDEAKKLQEGHTANIVAMAQSRLLLLAGPIATPGALRGIFIFKHAPREEILGAVEKDPLIKGGRLKLELVEWHVPKNSFILEKD